MKKLYKWKCQVCSHVNNAEKDRCFCCTSFSELNGLEIEERKRAWKEGKIIEDGILHKDWFKLADHDEGKTNQIFPKANTYKKRWILRIVIVLFLSITHYLVKDYHDPNFISDFKIIIAILCIGSIETMAVNLLTKRNFYPACQYVDWWFPNRHGGLANKIGYTIVFLFYACMCGWVLLFESWQ